MKAEEQRDAATMLASKRWGFIGSGKMATALIRGMLRVGVPAESISASDVHPEARATLASETGVATRETNREVVGQSDVVILAVKPQVMAAVTSEVGPMLSPDHLVISIAAGIGLATLEQGLGGGRRVARVMPNTPALVGAGASAYCLGANARPEDEATVREFVEAAGTAYSVPETLMDAVTGLSGSGPAFVYAMIEALSDGGVNVGLPRDIATGLASQTVLGAARMVLETGLHTGVLKDQVTSPGGTTIAGLHALERGSLRATLMNAVEAATRRSAELANAAKGRS
ncbi:pyrroline-5-carboxylate reductase [Tundrisphaera sp. TA3]|uniref:pyrroline-5-carboxylate reductase n=1 Tax=Tundrisphaera sp. TA3 TaxID=3435775 RepID=UPI003EB8215E